MYIMVTSLNSVRIKFKARRDVYRLHCSSVRPYLCVCPIQLLEAFVHDERLALMPLFCIAINFGLCTGCSINIVFFPNNSVIFLNSASSAAALVFYLPGVCTYIDTEGKQRKTRVRNIIKSLEKTQYLMNTLYIKVDIKPSFPFRFLISFLAAQSATLNA